MKEHEADQLWDAWIACGAARTPQGKAQGGWHLQKLRTCTPCSCCQRVPGNPHSSHLTGVRLLDARELARKLEERGQEVAALQAERAELASQLEAARAQAASAGALRGAVHFADLHWLLVCNTQSITRVFACRRQFGLGAAQGKVIKSILCSR